MRFRPRHPRGRSPGGAPLVGGRAPRPLPLTASLPVRALLSMACFGMGGSRCCRCHRQCWRRQWFCRRALLMAGAAFAWRSAAVRPHPPSRARAGACAHALWPFWCRWRFMLSLPSCIVAAGALPLAPMLPRWQSPRGEPLPGGPAPSSLASCDVAAGWMTSPFACGRWLIEGGPLHHA